MKPSYTSFVTCWILISIVLIFLFFQHTRSNTSNIILVTITASNTLDSYTHNPHGILSDLPPSFGYGVLISSEHILTAGHLASNTQADYSISGVWNTPLQANNIYLDEQNDIAILKLSAPLQKNISLKYASDIKIWDTVTSLWSKIKHGAITQIAGRHITHTIAFYPWESGSVLVNKKNEILAINTASSQNEDIGYSVMVDATSLAKFLQ